MFAENPVEYEQMSFFNSINGLTEREKRFLEKSWAKTFAEFIYISLNLYATTLNMKSLTVK